MRSLCLLLIVFCSLPSHAHGAPFRNLNFEEGTISYIGDGPRVDPVLAFPGWTVESPHTAFDTLTLGSSAQILMDNNWQGAPSFPILQGTYSVLLVRGEPWLVPAGLRQTASVPGDARSMSFAAAEWSSPLVSINGLDLQLVTLPAGRYGADVSSFAGQTVELRFTTEGGLFLDDILFSSNPVPEPASVAMIGLGLIGLVGYGVRRRISSNSRSA
jgi:hypothetical protein